MKTDNYFEKIVVKLLFVLHNFFINFFFFLLYVPLRT